MAKSKYNVWLGSSANPDKLSRTLKSLVPLVVFVFAAFKLDVTEGMIEEVATAVIAVVNAGFTLYYAVLKAKHHLKG